MKKKKGFTLIELLAVIVVLAIILVLAVPKILDVIENADKQAYKESAELMAHTVQIQYQTKEVTGSAPVIPEEGITYYYYNNKQVKSFEDGEKEIEITKTDDNYLNFKGDRPFSGTITLTKDKKVIISDLISKNKKWCVKKEENEKNARVGRRTDPEFNCKIEGEDEVVIEDKVACELETNDDKTEYYIDSPCDLYEFSNRVNSGENFSGKVVKVRNNLDMDLEKINADSDLVKKIKDNYGTTDFSPIGINLESAFSGTFDGGAKKISNLTINKNQDNVGLFGYVKGLNNDNKANIYGVRIVNDVDENNNYKGNITGNNFVGGLVGYVDENTNIKEIELDNINVIGNSRCVRIGGFAGFVTNSETVTINNILIKNAAVVGWNHVGYLTGVSSSRINNAIIEKLAFTMYAVGDSYTTSTTYNTYHSNSTSENNGYDSRGIDDINFYEAAGLDTWIGGDDGSGYYFDYDEQGKVRLKSTKENPITFSLSKDSDGYYLIKNEKDWKEASSKSKEKYKLTSNLDFSTNKYYMLGSSQKSNMFSGILNGNDKVIKNITINGNKANFLGMIGYVNSGKIYGFTIKNIEVNGYSNVGLFGQVIGTEEKKANIYGIRIVNDVDETGNYKGNITGITIVGGLVGHANSYTTIKEIELDNINVIGKSQQNANNIGSIIGFVTDTDTITINNILVKNVILKGWDYVGYLSGGNSNRIKNAIVEKLALTKYAVGYLYTTSSSNNTYHSNLISTSDGYDSRGIDDINFYEAAGLDTWIGGDNDTSGYYFDYDDQGKVRLKSVKQNPITHSLSKDSEGYYLIKNENDWKEASSKTKEKYKLDSDLDFSSNKYYMLGSSQTPNMFSGILNGNDKVIKNITVNGNKANFLGMIGFINSGTIYGFTINNIEVNGYSNVGLFGQVIGTEEKRANIYGIRIINDVDETGNYKGIITGTTVVGGLVGHANSYTTIREIELDNISVMGNCERNANNIGSIIGFVTDTDTITINNILVKNVILKGWDYVGYLSGGNSNRIKNTIVEKLALTKYAVGYLYTTNSSSNTYYSNASTLSGGSIFDSSYIDDIYYYKGILETLFTGDVNNTGYFFDLMDDGKIHLVKAYTLTPPTTEDTGESIGPSTGVCSRYPCTCECGCICNDGSDGATQTRCEAGCGLN